MFTKFSDVSIVSVRYNDFTFNTGQIIIDNTFKWNLPRAPTSFNDLVTLLNSA